MYRVIENRSQAKNEWDTSRQPALDDRVGASVMLSGADEQQSGNEILQDVRDHTRRE